MLDQIKLSLKDCLSKVDASIDISIDEIEVSLLFDEKGDFTTNIALKFSKLYKDYNNNPNESKALYHIRAYNPNTGEFDYALDVNSSCNLQPGKLNKTLQTSLYVYKQKGTGYILENYG